MRTLNLRLLVISVLASSSVFAQKHSFDVGLRFQKTVDLYYENGFTVNYNLNERWVVGTSFISSRLGSAMGSNAIKQDNYLLSASYLFRPAKALKPFARVNTGYFNADYESPIFKSLTHSSAIASLDGGLIYAFKCPLKINLSLGYNLITGDGTSGAGTLYPVFYQTSLTWNLKKEAKK